MSESLVDPTRRCVAAVGSALEEVSSGVAGVRTDDLRQDATLEAFNLVSGLIGADGRQSDDELWALLTAFGPLLETRLAGATPAALRDAEVLTRQAEFASTPSSMFRLLLAADAKNGSSHARRYYDHAVELAFSVAAIDLHTSATELEVIEDLRGMLLHAIEAMEGSRTPAAAPGGAATTNAQSLEAAGEAPRTEDPPPRPIDALLADLDELVGDRKSTRLNSSH